MTTAESCSVDMSTAVGTACPSSSSDNMEWHGVYRDLLFQRGAVNPPCSHMKGAVYPDSLAADGRASGCRGPGTDFRDVATQDQNGHLNTSAAAFVQDFLSESSKVRERGCSNIPRIFHALGNAVHEFVFFLQDFEEGEDDEDVLIALCNELKRFFQSFGSGDQAHEERSTLWPAEGFSTISSLLLRILLHRDRELKMAALGAFIALVSACDDTDVLKHKIISQVLELSEDQRDTFREAAASLLPTTLHCARRCAAELQTGQQAQEAAGHKQSLDMLVKLKRLLLDSYVRLCGDKNCAVQHAAGQQLPVFVDYIAAEVEDLHQGQLLKQEHFNTSMDSSAAASDGEIGELMVAVYKATQKFTLSLNESCRMQGVAAVAAMARRNATVFKALGTNFFPMLCSDTSWRVRANVCLALESLALLFSDSTVKMDAEGAGNHVVAAVTASCMPSLLFKFLTDRSPMVKIAALQQLPRTAQLVGHAAFVRDSWILELQQIAEDESSTAGSRLTGACVDALIAILPLTNGDQRRTLLELVMELARRGSWKLKITFLGSLGSLTRDELTLVSPMILSDSFAWDEDGDDCWRVHAAVAQQLPVMLSAELEKREDESWWQRCNSLLLHPAWAVRQEAGIALRSIVLVGL